MKFIKFIKTLKGYIKHFIQCFLLVTCFISESNFTIVLCNRLNKRIKYMKNCRWFYVVTKKTFFIENSALLAFKPRVFSDTKNFPVDEILTPRYLYWFTYSKTFSPTLNKLWSFGTRPFFEKIITFDLSTLTLSPQLLQNSFTLSILYCRPLSIVDINNKSSAYNKL